VTTFILGSQVVFVGLDLTPFMSFHNGSLSLASNFYDPHTLAGVLAVPPAWTLGLEFAFYLIAPFIVRRSVKAIVILFFCSIAFRLFLQFDFGLYNDPWSYRFFSSELALFLVGVLGYRVYRSLENGRDMRLLALFTGVCFCVAGAVLVNRWHGWSRVASTGLLLLLLLAIPFLFRICKTNRLDRFVGELSYPIYICHFLVIWTLTYLWGMSAGMFRGFVILMTTVLLSIVIYPAIDRPIDGWRHKQFAPRVRQTISAPAASAALS
jgi:peptidoglycan/LPS O-acetylase OafA/YrhL